MRLIFIKKEWMSYLFWLILPVIATWFIITQFMWVQSDAQVPVGVVVKDDSHLAADLIKSIKQTPYLRPVKLTEKTALNELEKHELDSVFLIPTDYGEKLKKGMRKQLVKSFYSNLSFAYTPVRETILSYVQRDYIRYQTIQTLQQLHKDYQVEHEWSDQELLARSKEIEDEQELLDVNFTMNQQSKSKKSSSSSPIDPIYIWALFAMLTTFMLLDWIVKERKSSASLRFAFLKTSFKQYLIANLFLYTLLMFLFDIISIILWGVLYDVVVSWQLVLSVLLYRIMLNSVICCIGLLFRSVYMYYVVSFIIVLFVAIGSGIIVPVDRLSLNVFLQYIHPLNIFLFDQKINFWIIGSVSYLMIWYMRGRKKCLMYNR